MDMITCLQTKRSVRNYRDEVIPNEIIKQLIELGTMASTGSNMQPWGFVSIQDKNEINEMSENIKKELLASLEAYPHLMQYKNWLENPKYSVFNHASNLLIIYGNKESYYYREDCSLCAGNIMLAAHSMDIGSCWIGFAEYHANTLEFKKKYNVPENYDLVCAMTLGYKKVELTPPKRKEAVIFNHKTS